MPEKQSRSSILTRSKLKARLVDDTDAERDYLAGFRGGWPSFACSKRMADKKEEAANERRIAALKLMVLSPKDYADGLMKILWRITQTAKDAKPTSPTGFNVEAEANKRIIMLRERLLILLPIFAERYALPFDSGVLDGAIIDLATRYPIADNALRIVDGAYWRLFNFDWKGITPAQSATSSASHNAENKHPLGRDDYRLTWKEDGTPCWGSKLFKGPSQAKILIVFLANKGGKVHWETLAKELHSANWEHGTDDNAAREAKKSKAKRNVATAITRLRNAVKTCWGWEAKMLPELNAQGFYLLDLHESLYDKLPVYHENAKSQNAPRDYRNITKSKKRLVIFDSKTAEKSENSEQ